MKSKAQATKAKIDKWDSIARESFCVAGEALGRVLGSLSLEWEKMFENHELDKRLISKPFAKRKIFC